MIQFHHELFTHVFINGIFKFFFFIFYEAFRNRSWRIYHKKYTFFVLNCGGFVNLREKLYYEFILRRMFFIFFFFSKCRTCQKEWNWFKYFYSSSSTERIVIPTIPRPLLLLNSPISIFHLLRKILRWMHSTPFVFLKCQWFYRIEIVVLIWLSEPNCRNHKILKTIYAPFKFSLN